MKKLRIFKSTNKEGEIYIDLKEITLITVEENKTIVYFKNRLNATFPREDYADILEFWEALVNE